MAAITVAGLLCVYSLSAARFLSGRQDRFFGFVTRYTMAIWLMHEMLAQLVFWLLFVRGFCPGGAFDAAWPWVCGMGCLVACYVLPIIVMSALSRIWKLGFIVYPSRYLAQGTILRVR